MDAKVDGWVVTPRRGKPVEIQALWYNALRLMAVGARNGGASRRIPCTGRGMPRDIPFQSIAFGSPPAGYLYDVIDGEQARMTSAYAPIRSFTISLQVPDPKPEH